MTAFSQLSRVRAPLILLAAVEATIVYSSVYIAALLLFGELASFEREAGPLWLRAAIVTVVILVSLIAMGLYQFHQRIYFREAAVRVIAAVVAGSLGLAVLFYAAPSITLTRNMALVAIAYSLLLLLVVRLFFLRNVDENIFRRKSLVFGAGDRAQSIQELRRRADRRGFKIVGRVPAPGDREIESRNVLRLDGRSICEIARETGADEVVVAMDDRRGNLPIRELLDCRLRGIEVIDLLEFLERETGKIRVDLVNPGWLIFSPGFRSSRFRRYNQRLLDLAVSTALILLTWPIVLAVIAAIKLEEGPRAPVLYRQVRVGRSNRHFNVLKFRSMRVDAEADGKAKWAEQDDARITRVGYWLRKFRLDELPQLFNVLRGQMSLVGPRPERPEFVDSLKESIPYYSERHTVNPGLTGWAQLRYSYGANEEDALEKLQYDLYYVKNQNLLLDMMIILQTVEVVLWGKGAR